MEKTYIYIEDKILSILSRMGSTFYELSLLHEIGEEPKELYYEKELSIKDKFLTDADLAYMIICCYLESKNLTDYLVVFKKTIRPMIDDPKQLFNSVYDEYVGEQFSIFLPKLWNFLIPFEFSQGTYLDQLLKQAGVTYLERILRKTQVILDKVKVFPASEPQVYKEVKFVIESVFTDSKSPSGEFLKNFKNYKPDVLIPEIHAAVEYKYAKSERELKSQFDQICADTHAYTDNPTYQLFYAVFYVTNDFWGIDKFKQAWREMKTPKNWKGIYIIGKG